MSLDFHVSQPLSMDDLCDGRLEPFGITAMTLPDGDVLLKHGVGGMRFFGANDRMLRDGISKGESINDVMSIVNRVELEFDTKFIADVW